MRVEEAIRNRRSIRRFRQDPVPVELLHRLSDLARLYPSAGNQQPIRTAIVTKAPHLQEVFKTLRWAMYLPDYAPAENERPTAYLILLSEQKNCLFDLGAAAMAVTLAAQEQGLASCCLQSAEPKKIQHLLGLPKQMEALLVIALGYGAQESCMIPAEDDLRYRQIENGALVVPKLTLERTLLYSDI